MNEMRWIPVKERLPEDDGKVIVTEKWTHHSYSEIRFYSKNIKEWVDNNISVTEAPFEEYVDYNNDPIEDISNLSGFFEIEDVMTDDGYAVTVIRIYPTGRISAWMPFPEPYKED